MANLPRQIIGSFEDIGKQIGTEVVKAPTEIAGKALESLGASSKGTKGQAAIPSMKPAEAAAGSLTPMDEFGQAKDAKTKQAIARAALQYLAAKNQPGQPSIRERLEREEAEKKKMEQEKAAAALQPLEQPKSKRKRGDLYGTKAKAAATEKKSVRQD